MEKYDDTYSYEIKKLKRKHRKRLAKIMKHAAIASQQDTDNFTKQEKAQYMVNSYNDQEELDWIIDEILIVYENDEKCDIDEVEDDITEAIVKTFLETLMSTATDGQTSDST